MKRSLTLPSLLLTTATANTSAQSAEFASADCLHSEERDSPEDFATQNSDRCCAMRQLSQNIYPPNGHIIEGHLCLIMLGCSLGYK